MNRLHRSGVEAWPVRYEAYDYSPLLRKIIIVSNRPHDKSEVHLTPDQALYAQARLSVIKSAYLNGHSGSIHQLGSNQLPDDHAYRMTSCGAKVWTLISGEGSTAEVLTGGDGEHSYRWIRMVYLVPDEALADRGPADADHNGFPA